MLLHSCAVFRPAVRFDPDVSFFEAQLTGERMLCHSNYRCRVDLITFELCQRPVDPRQLDAVLYNHVGQYRRYWKQNKLHVGIEALNLFAKRDDNLTFFY